MAFNCKLIIYSNCNHLQQIYAGFNTLFNHNYINLEIDASNYTIGSNTSILRMILNNKFIVYYDTYDGYNFSDKSFDEDMNIFNSYLRDADYYFKRSCSPEINNSTNYSNKIFPLGLNYIFDTNNKSDFIQGSLKKSIFKKSLQLVKDIRHSKLLNNLLSMDHKYINQEHIEFIPYTNDNPIVLFMARLWDPETIDNVLLKDEWKSINNSRIECVKLLRKEFKNNFIGGIVENSFSKQLCKEFTLSSDYTQRNKYIKLMHNADICVATTGLHNSIGYKFAEYVASSKAIVTEPLQYVLPGNFTNNENYCEFRNPDECVSVIYNLMSNRRLRINMMINNYHYYNNHVRPDNLVLNTIYRIIDNLILINPTTQLPA